jgi:hypothetical protein
MKLIPDSWEKSCEGGNPGLELTLKTSLSIDNPPEPKYMSDCLTQYYRCPDNYARFALKGRLSDKSGYFRFGPDTVYGKCSGHVPADSPLDPLYDASQDTTVDKGRTYLSFDFAQVVESLRRESYADAAREGKSPVGSALSRIYYFFRPLLPVGVRKHLQKVRLNGWDRRPFPRWPVDRTVDDVFEHLLRLSLRSSGKDRIPFIWFWPEGATSAAIMTHDVETTEGRDFCQTVMDIDDSFGIKASFQIVPEQRYEVPPGFLKSITDRGFEAAVQDLNHDGFLYKNRQQFIARAAKINAYGRQWRASGFRAAILYRRQEWFDALEFSYDMSVPNVAHLDPQRGGCCTVMPYFVGNLLELPVTTTQDYSLFHILKDYSIGLWKQQIDLVMEKHGLISFIVHPDYITTSRERETYEALLAHLTRLREENGVWMPTPNEANRWWRQRAEMSIVEDGGNLRIEGAGKERARIAFASERGGRLVYSMDSGEVEGSPAMAEGQGHTN